MDNQHIRLQPSKGWISLQLDELWNYRELLYFLTWRDVKVRYKQTVLGAAWAVLQPFLTMIIFTIFFGKMANVGSDGLPYPIFSYAGLLPWTFFAQGLSQSSNSLVGSANLLKKIYFPRLVIPISSVLAPAVDFFIAFAVLLIMMVWYGIIPGIRVIFLPFLLILTFTTALGTGMWLSAMNVQFRDIKYVIPFFIQIWLFATPVIYPASKVFTFMEQRGIPVWLFGLNPLTGIVEGFRWCLLGTGSRSFSIMVASTIVSFSLFISGVYYFRRMERTFADVV